MDGTDVTQGIEELFEETRSPGRLELTLRETRFIAGADWGYSREALLDFYSFLTAGLDGLYDARNTAPEGGQSNMATSGVVQSRDPERSSELQETTTVAYAPENICGIPVTVTMTYTRDIRMTQPEGEQDRCDHEYAIQFTFAYDQQTVDGMDSFQPTEEQTRIRVGAGYAAPTPDDMFRTQLFERLEHAMLKEFYLDVHAPQRPDDHNLEPLMDQISC